MGSGTGEATSRPARGTALFAWVKQALLDAIERGEYSPDAAFVTQKQIVERFGVSTTTAVRALNELVADGVVERRRGQGTFVTQRPAPHDAPSAPPAPPAPSAPSAPPPRGQRTIAYIRPDDGGSHAAQLLSGLVTQSAAAGCQLTVSHSRGPRDETRLLAAAAGAGAGAVVFFAHDGSSAAGAVEALGRRGVPVVMVDRYFPHLPTDAVLFDDFAVGHALTAALVERGHTSLAALWSEVDVTSVRDRLSGHYRALREAGLPEVPDRSALRRYPGLDPAARRARLRELLDAPEAPTALVCGNAVTLAVLATDLLALDGGLPDGLELASMDEAGPTDVSPLAAASARLPGREMGQEAVRLAVARLDGTLPAGSGPHRHVVLGAEVHVAQGRRNTLAVVGPPPG